VSTGSCKLCRSEFRSEINRRLARGETREQVQEWLATKDFKVSLPTLTTHRQHITDPKTTLVEQAQRNPAIRRVTNSEFLETIRDIGAQRAIDNPDSVSLTHALKAAAQLEARQNKQIDVMLAIAQMATKRLAPTADIELLEGEGYQEVLSLGSSEASSSRS
jgi:hypothetical protein